MTIDPSEVETLAGLAEEYLTADVHSQTTLFAEQARMAAAHLPARLRVALEALRCRQGGVGALLVHRPEAPCPLPTPMSNRSRVGAQTRLARQQTIVTAALGELVAYKAEAYGSLIQDVVPNPDLSGSQTSQSYAVALQGHIEQAFSPLQPDWLSMACLRGHEGAETLLWTPLDLAAALTPAELALAQTRRWMFGVDESFRDDRAGSDQGRGPFPMLSPFGGAFALRYDEDLQEGTTPEAQDLLLKVSALYRSHRLSISLCAGDLLLINNKTTVHGRSAFTPSFRGADRFLTRVLAVNELAKSQGAREGASRVICL